MSRLESAVPAAEISFRFERSKLAEAAAALRSQWAGADPFPHVVIKNFLPAQVAQAVALQFPKLGDINWHLAGSGNAVHTNDPNIEKVDSPDEDQFPLLIRQVLHELNSATFLDFVTAITGFENLIPDPWFGGGGLHSTGRGGRLMIHSDSDRHPNRSLKQILNLILYLTPDWQPEWGGGLELWDKTGKHHVKTVVPEFNSMVLFYTGSRSYHGHPHPLTCPPGLRRNSMAVYYYTTDRKKDADYYGQKDFVTWVHTNEHDGKPKLSTVVKEAARKVLPPAVMRKIEGVREGLRR